MNLKIILILYIAFLQSLFAVSGQSSIDEVLKQVEANSTALQALRQQAEAQKLENRTGIYLENPEVGFNYLWGDPSSEGRRKDFSVTQSFDFPTAYTHKSRIAKGKNNISDYEYRRLRKELLLQAGTACVSLIYANAVKVELDKRLRHAQSIASSWQERFARGDTDILERNKAQLNLLNARKAVETNEIERSALLSDLKRLNGGMEISLTDTSYPVWLIPQDFDQWVEQAQSNNPELNVLMQEIEVSQRREKLNRAMSLPKLSAGYMSESVPKSSFRGLALGISVPLWENKNTVKQAKAQTIALQNMEEDTRQQFILSLRTQHSKALSLQEMADEYRRILQSTNTAELLKTALDKGHISLINYMIELSVYYEAMDNVLQAERDSWFAILELRQWEEN
jgi:outer membrane protein TolC